MTVMLRVIAAFLMLLAVYVASFVLSSRSIVQALIAVPRDGQVHKDLIGPQAVTTILDSIARTA
jgi:hypothetical protein